MLSTVCTISYRLAFAGIACESSEGRKSNFSRCFGMFMMIINIISRRNAQFHILGRTARSNFDWIPIFMTSAIRIPLGSLEPSDSIPSFHRHSAESMPKGNFLIISGKGSMFGEECLTECFRPMWSGHYRKAITGILIAAHFFCVPTWAPLHKANKASLLSYWVSWIIAH